jgi:hypothetical protein
LYASLLEAFDGREISAMERVRNFEKLMGTKAINPVKSEYPNGTRFDIAIISPRSNQVKALWDQDVCVALELKLWQIDGTGGGPRGDIHKLARYRDQLAQPNSFSGHSIVFVHPGCNWKKHFNEFDFSTNDESLEPGLWLHIIDLSQSDNKWLSADMTAYGQLR